MIFVTVGNATQGFRRLLDAVDQFAGAGLFGHDEIFIQSGNNPGFCPLNCKCEPFLTMNDFDVKINRADVIMCHAGAGTLLQAFQAGKIPVVVPRRKAYGEHVDDHQLELVEALAADDRVIPAYEPDELPAAVAKAYEVNRRREVLGVRSEGKESRMIELVSKAIEELMERRR